MLILILAATTLKWLSLEVGCGNYHTQWYANGLLMYKWFLSCFLVHWIICIYADVIAAIHAWSGTSSCSSVMMIAIWNERPTGFLHILDFYWVLLNALTWLEMSWYHYCNICMEQKNTIFWLWRTSSCSSVMTIATCNEMPMIFLHIFIFDPALLSALTLLKVSWCCYCNVCMMQKQIL